MKKKLPLFFLLIIVFAFGFHVGSKRSNDIVKSSSKYQPLTAASSLPKLPSAQITKNTKTSTDKPSYVANKKTKKFHKPNCSSVKQMNESNKVYYSCSRSEMISNGYDPCGRCNP